MYITDLGILPYVEAEALQRQAFERVRGGGPATLFLLEHTPVITFGRHGGRENLPFAPEWFHSRGVDVAQSERGGNITCHFPGQLVAYPVMRVDGRPGGLKGYFYDLEETALRTLCLLGIAATRRPGFPGLWVGGRKICSVGIAVKRWIAFHGLSLNVGRDLALFEMISPCGLGVAATSVHRELDCEDVGMDEVKSLFLAEFQTVFGVERTEA